MKKKTKLVNSSARKSEQLTAREHKKLTRRIQKRHDQLRKKYPEIHGKVVDWVSHSIEDNWLYVNVSFQDQTQFCLRFSPEITARQVDLSDIGTGDVEIIRRY